MRGGRLFLATLAAGTAFLISPFPLALSHAADAKPAHSAVLSGQVSSPDEPSMEGVLVSAKKSGSTITVTVVSDARGHYAFPAGRLGSGRYALSIRAGGYDLDSPATVNISAGKNTTAEIKLRKTANLAAQLANSDWLASFPGTDDQKASVQNCSHCHTLERVARSHHTAAEFMDVLDRMSRHTPNSFPLMVQQDSPGRLGGEPSPEQVAAQRHRQADYLATVNLSSGEQWQYPLKITPRPSGKATQVIITEYDLPQRTRQPHDVVVDREGTVWYASFGELILGKLDPKTGKTTEYPIPEANPRRIKGNLDLDLDEDQNVWIAMTFQGAIAKFDRKTSKIRVYKLPPELDGDYRELICVAAAHSKVDGKVWISDFGSWTILRLDTASGKFEVFEPFPKPGVALYDIASDTQNNAVFTLFGRQDIGTIDAKTGKISVHPVPTQRSAPRRGNMDAQDRYWFAENRSNKIGVFDTKTNEVREWEVPIPFYLPYDVAPDKNGEAWAVSEFTDSVLRFDPKTGQFTNYLMPRETNMRRAFVDDSGLRVKFWVGNTHEAGIIRVEPLE